MSAEQEQVGGVDLGALRAAAEAATPGRWGVFGMTVLASTDGTSNVDTAVEIAQGLTRDEREMPRTWDVDFIAAASPAVVLALLDELEQMRADAADWRRVTERAWAGDSMEGRWKHVKAPDSAQGNEEDR